MDLEWDEDKRRSNLEKHGLDFGEVQYLDWDNATLVQDQRYPYAEPRFWAFAMRARRLYFVAFCMRGKKVRIISFRKANGKEQRRYGKKIYP